MKFLTASEAAGQPILHTFRSGDWMGSMLAALTMLGIATYAAVPKGDPTPLPIIAVPTLVGLALLALASTQWLRTRRPDNWRLRQAEGGVLINLYSHAAPAADAGQPTVLWLDRTEIAAICHTLETQHFPVRHRTTYRRTYIDFYLTHEDTAAIRDLLYTARRRIPLRKSVDVPVRVLEPAGVRLAWDWIRPPEKRALKLLGQHYTIAPSLTPGMDWDKLDDKGKEAFVRQLWEFGQVDEAYGALRQYRRLDSRSAWAWIAQHCAEAPPLATNPERPAPRRR